MLNDSTHSASSSGTRPISNKVSNAGRWPSKTGAILAAGSMLLLSGCANVIAPLNPLSGGNSLTGGVHGGQQPVSGAQVYLYAASTSGYSGAATSLLGGPGFVTTAADGTFSITADYTCPTGAYVYALALGGNPGLSAGTNNSNLALMAGIGPCSSLTPSSYIAINEATTVAMAFALAPFMSSETLVGTSSTNVTGLANAFATVPNLVSPVGLARATTPAGNGVVPQATINALANALAPCVNSTGIGAPCTTLMTAANVTGGGGTPIDTAQAAINIAHHPGVNVASIYNQSTPNAVFQPALTAAPNDWTLTVSFGSTTGGVNQAQGMAFDATGNLWITNFLTPSISEFSPTGVQLSPGSGYTTATMFRPQGIAVDLAGNIWVGSRQNGTTAASLEKFSSSGVLLSGATGYVGGGLNTPRFVAIDAAGNIWLAGNSELSEFTSAGVPVSGVSGYTGGGLQTAMWSLAIDTNRNVWAAGFQGGQSSPTVASVLAEFTPVSVAQNNLGTYGGTFNGTGVQPGTQNWSISVAIDASNNVWVANGYNAGAVGAVSGSVSEYSNAGALLSPTVGYTTGGVNTPQDVKIDGNGNVFTSQSQVSQMTNTGAGVSPSTGYLNPNPNDCCLAAAIDLSGNYWLGGGANIYQMVGLAAPVVTPTVKALVNGQLGMKP